ncbi:MAG: Holliday junction resolvase RuvX [Patescibacteria group bacterium]|nr:Holliday junction resolvase RuvX [Patescibacteria group bacterium]
MLLGIDYGAKRIGLATGDKETRLALPLKTLLNDKDFLDSLKGICKVEDIKEIVVGIPLPLYGKEGEQVKRVKNFVEKLKKEFKLPIKTIDEKLTTHEVESHFVKFKKEMKKIDKDALAASIILQTHLDKV